MVRVKPISTVNWSHTRQNKTWGCSTWDVGTVISRSNSNREKWVRRRPAIVMEPINVSVKSYIDNR